MRLLIIGLDGATFDVLDPLMAKGSLPNLNQFITHGVRGPLESTVPPITAPAWMALATGKNPGKTGVFDFFNRTQTSDFELASANSFQMRRAGCYWDLVQEVGMEVGVFNYPGLHPPYEVEGFVVSGVGTPSTDNITFPPELMEKLIQVGGPYQISVSWHFPKYTNNVSLFVKDVMEQLERRAKILEFLLKQEVDVLTIVISVTDFIQHYMWKFIDEMHPSYDPAAASRYGPDFLRIWQRVDQILGTIFESSSGVNTLIVSDHGFGPVKGKFYANTWLEREGLLFWRHGSKEARARASGLRRILHQVGKISPRLHRHLLNVGRKHRRFVEGPAAWIDLRKTAAFCWSASQTGSIYINRLPDSPIRTEADCTAVKLKVINGLRRIAAEKGIGSNVLSAEEVYDGHFVGLAPQIIFDFDDFGYLISRMPGKELFPTASRSPNASGMHKKNGIFLARGPDIRKNHRVEGATIYDIAPTILHMLGLPVSGNVDGKVRRQIFREDSEPAGREVQYREEGPGGAETGYQVHSADEEEQVEHHLRGLGYLD